MPECCGDSHWTSELILLTTGKIELSTELTEQLTAAGVRVQASPVTRLRGRDGKHLTTRMQGAVLAAAAGTRAAAMLNAELTAELATSGVLRQRVPGVMGSKIARRG